MMVRLAVDASTTGTTSCAVGDGRRQAALEVAEGAAEALADAARRAVVALDADLRDVSEVIVGVGPGSFTGIRSAVTFANAVAFANGAGVRTIVGLEAIAYEHCADGEAVAVAMEAGRGRSYVATYRRDGDGLLTVTPPATVDEVRAEAERIVALDGVLVIGGAVTRVRRRGPDAATYLRLAPALAKDAPAGAAALYLGPPLRRS